MWCFYWKVQEKERKGNAWCPVLPTGLSPGPSLSSHLSHCLFSTEPGCQAPNHLTRQYFVLISFWKFRKVKQLNLSHPRQGRVGVGRLISHSLVSWGAGGGEGGQPHPATLPGSRNLSPHQLLGFICIGGSATLPRLPKCSTVGTLSSCLFWLTSLPRADRPGNGYRPRAAGEGLIQCWKGALVVKPFNGPHPMIISPGLQLANWEPL